MKIVSLFILEVKSKFSHASIPSDFMYFNSFAILTIVYNKNKAHTKRTTDRNGMKCNGIPHPSSSPFKDFTTKHSSHHQNTKLPYNNGKMAHLTLPPPPLLIVLSSHKTFTNFCILFYCFEWIKKETGMHLKLVINRSNMDVGCDQGYGSERSPEDELPPILSIPYQSIEAQPLYQQKAQQYNRDKISESDFNFITSG